jgi:two-component system alkaline phosphatase synthesis response regulator PhoP
MQRTILVIVKEDDLRKAIIERLRCEGYIVCAAHCDQLAMLDEEVLALVHNQRPSLFLLDSASLDGRMFDLCRQLRLHEETAALPILMLVRSDSEINRLVHSDLRIDDYVVRPLFWEELLACVHTLVRSGKRRSRHKIAQRNAVRRKVVYPEGQVLVVNDLRIDVDRFSVTRNNQLVELRQPLLFDLLLYLVQHRGMVLTRDHLLKYVWGYEHKHDSRTVDVHMRWLRERLEEDPAHPHLIQTIRGVGYRFNA